MKNTATVETNKTKRTDMMRVDPRNIVIVPNFNSRKDMGDLDELLNSILENGLQMPLHAAKVQNEDKYELVEGERRLRAILLGIERGHDFQFIDVIPFKGNQEQRLLSMIVTGIGQKRLTELEQADAVKKLSNLGYTPEKIAQKIAKSVAHVYNLLAMDSFTEELKKEIHSGTISATTVLNITRTEKDPKKQISIVRTAVKEAGVSASTGKAKTVTTRDVKVLKKQNLEAKLDTVLETLKNQKTKTANAKAFVEFVEMAKTKSVEELVVFLTKK